MEGKNQQKLIKYFSRRKKMTKKTETIVTTILGLCITAANTLVALFAPNYAPMTIAITGSVNEVVNVILQQFVKS